MHEYHVGKAKFGEATFGQCCKHGEEELPALNPPLLCWLQAETWGCLQSEEHQVL